jgi:hypothetical protein
VTAKKHRVTGQATRRNGPAVSRRTLSNMRICAFIFTISTVVSRVTSAQEVPPPPKPEAAGPSLALAPLLESLKHTLLSSGRVEYNAISGTNTYKVWQHVTNAVVDARGCQARIHYDNSFNGQDATDQARSFFFESIDTVEALSQQELHDRNPNAVNWSSGAWLLFVNGSPGSLVFTTRAEATSAADALRDAAQICRAAPVVLNATPGAPSLADTLQFIAEKLNDEGAVNYRAINQNSDGSTAGNPSSMSQRITQASPDPSTCQVRFNRRLTVDGSDTRTVISFRRVEKLEVSTYQDSVNRLRARSGSVQLFKTEPVVYRLGVILAGGTTVTPYFRDEEMANRIAKAMTHAVELCGGGSKDPF